MQFTELNFNYYKPLMIWLLLLTIMVFLIVVIVLCFIILHQILLFVVYLYLLLSLCSTIIFTPRKVLNSFLFKGIGAISTLVSFLPILKQKQDEIFFHETDSDPGPDGNRIWPPLHALCVASLNVFPS